MKVRQPCTDGTVEHAARAWVNAMDATGTPRSGGRPAIVQKRPACAATGTSVRWRKRRAGTPGRTALAKLPGLHGHRVPVRRVLVEVCS